LLLAWTCAGEALAAPPKQGDTAAEVQVATLRGRVRERGADRTPVSGAKVIVVDAPPDVRPGEAKQPLDPEAVAWMHEAETDADGRFELPEIPTGNVRVIVIAAGYVRIEQFAANETDVRELELYIQPEANGPYRTVVATERQRSWTEVEPDSTLDAQRARHYPGARDDPMLAALNLPGVSRSPGGLGLVAFRGGDPTEVGFYVDGHPVPRTFHVIPIASVVSPPMMGDLELTPGNYSAAYGSFGGGMVRLDSRPGRRDGIHGEAHLDLFDVGATTEGPVGKGSVNIGIRRSHVGDVLRAIPSFGRSTPNFWDYLTRFDYPLGNGHAIGLRGLGAGDRFALPGWLDFRSNFHRFDVEYRFVRKTWRVLVSPSVRLDSTKLESDSYANAQRKAYVVSVRAVASTQPLQRLGLEFGADAVVERWHRHQAGQLVFTPQPEPGEGSWGPDGPQSFDGAHVRSGVWLATPVHVGDWSLIPSVRLNVFAYGSVPSVRIDPRLHVRGRLSDSLRLIAAVGLYATPIVGQYQRGSNGISTYADVFTTAVVDVPDYLIRFFDVNLDGEVVDGSTSAIQVLQAQLGIEAELPWDLDMRALGFWRSAPGHTFEPVDFDDESGFGAPPPEFVGRKRAMGMEVLLRRTLAPGVVDGWLGYTLLWARVEEREYSYVPPAEWLPAVFDQRHNLVALLSFSLPRGFRFGVRFRLGSGNPLEPVTGRDVVTMNLERPIYLPIRAPRGSEYQPMFHQLDLRIDKSWTLDRTTVGVYFDVQNVYNRWYPELWIYSYDWSSRERAIGLPIYPSLGMRVEY
jgi:hypothetical protein